MYDTVVPPESQAAAAGRRRSSHLITTCLLIRTMADSPSVPMVNRGGDDDDDGPPISSNQRQRAGCFSACMCLVCMLGPILVAIAIAYLSSEQVESGREGKVSAFNAAVRAWDPPGGGGGRAELERATFLCKSVVDSTVTILRADRAPEGCRAADTEQGAGLDQNLQPLRYVFTALPSRVPLFDQSWDPSHISHMSIGAAFDTLDPGTGMMPSSSVLNVSFATFTQRTESMSLAACTQVCAMAVSRTAGRRAGRGGAPL